MYKKTWDRHQRGASNSLHHLKHPCLQLSFRERLLHISIVRMHIQVSSSHSGSLRIDSSLYLERKAFTYNHSTYIHSFDTHRFKRTFKHIAKSKRNATKFLCTTADLRQTEFLYISPKSLLSSPDRQARRIAFSKNRDKTQPMLWSNTTTS